MEAGPTHVCLDQVLFIVMEWKLKCQHFMMIRSARASTGTEPCELKLGENVAAFLNNEEVKTGAKIRPGESLVHRSGHDISKLYIILLYNSLFNPII